MSTSFFFGDSVKNYANISKKSLDSHNEVYLKTVVCLFSSIRYFSKDVNLRFYVNRLETFRQLKNGFYAEVLRNLQVEVIEVAAKFVDPVKAWAGSMFIFDIIHYLIETEDIHYGHIFLDTDVVFLNDFHKIMSILEKYEWAGYAQYSEFGRSHCWLENFHGIHVELDDAIPYGGEFLYLHSRSLVDFFNAFQTVHSEMHDVYFTEEHYYTAILNSGTFLGKKNLNINPFFKRAFRVNKCLDDQYMWGIHLPGEKDYKLKHLYNHLNKNNFHFVPDSAKKILGVATLFNQYDLLTAGKILKKLLKMFTSRTSHF